MCDALIPITHVAMEINSTADELASRFPNEILLDGLNRHCLDHDIAAGLIGEYRAAQEAAAAAQRQRDEQAQAEQQRFAAIRAAEDRARQALEQRQRELLRDNPELDAAMLTRLAAGDDGNLGPASQRFDEQFEAGRRGVVGYLHTYPAMAQED